MDKIARNIDFLRYLVVAVPTQRKQLLRGLSREQIQVLSEICLNLLHGNFEIADEDFLALSKHKSTLRKLAVKSIDNNTKRELMYRDANGIRTLVSAFLAQFDKDSESDSSLSDEHSSPQKPVSVKSNSAGTNACGNSWNREGLSQADTDTGVSLSAADSEAAAAAAAAATSETESDTRGKKDIRETEVFSTASPGVRKKHSLNDEMNTGGAASEMGESVSVKNQQSVSDHIMGMISQTFPRTYREKAISLLLYLLQFGKGVVQVDRSGALRINDRRMEFSIVDYIYSSLVSEGTERQPDDFDYFEMAMGQINVPAHLLKNRRKRKDVSFDARPKTKRTKWLSY